MSDFDENLTDSADRGAAEALRLKLEDPQGLVDLIDGLRYSDRVDPDDHRFVLVEIRMPIFTSDPDDFEPCELEGVQAGSRLGGFCHGMANSYARGAMMARATEPDGGSDN